MRFDMRAPGQSPDQRAALYAAAVQMAAWADGNGCLAAVVCEHHVSDDGYLPTPLLLASAMAAVTTTLPLSVAASIFPLHDPVRLAEEMIVLDHLSRGRVSHTLAIGYRPEEYDLFGVDYHRRGALAEEQLPILLGHLRGTAASPVTPGPFTEGGPMVSWGGGSVAAARRAGRLGLNFIAQTDKPELREAYLEAAKAAGQEPGLCLLPSVEAPNSVFVNDDVDQGWADVGEALLADARSYAAWNEAAGMADFTASISRGTTVDELRAEQGSHRVVTVEQAAGLVDQYGYLGLQPLCGGLDPEVAWTYLRRVVDEVLPTLSQPG